MLYCWYQSRHKECPQPGCTSLSVKTWDRNDRQKLLHVQGDWRDKDKMRNKTSVSKNKYDKKFVPGWGMNQKKERETVDCAHTHENDSLVTTQTEDNQIKHHSKTFISYISPTDRAR